MPNLKDLIGASPELLEDEVRRLGGIDPLMAGVQSARYREMGADPTLVAMSPEDRAALDRYTTFARLRERSGNPVSAGINYLGGMGAMAATEAMKYAQPVQAAASRAWGALTGSETPFFGGADTSEPNLANLLASHYGFTRARPEEEIVGPDYGLQGAEISAQPERGGTIRSLLAAVLASGK